MTTIELIERIRSWRKSMTKGTWFTVQAPWRDPDIGTYIIAGNADPHIGKPVIDSIEIDEWPAGSEPDYSQSDADLEGVCFIINHVPDIVRALQRSHDFDKNMAEKSRRQKECSDKLRAALKELALWKAEALAAEQWAIDRRTSPISGGWSDARNARIAFNAPEGQANVATGDRGSAREPVEKSPTRSAASFTESPKVTVLKPAGCATPKPGEFFLIEDTISGHRRMAYIVRMSDRGTVWLRKATTSRRTGPTWTKDTTPTHYERLVGHAPKDLVRSVLTTHGDPAPSAALRVLRGEELSASLRVSPCPPW